MAADLGPRGTTANVIVPDAIATDFSGGQLRDDAEGPGAHRGDDRARPLGRADDIGRAIAALPAPGRRVDDRPANRGLRRPPPLKPRAEPGARRRAHEARDDPPAAPDLDRHRLRDRRDRRGRAPPPPASRLPATVAVIRDDCARCPTTLPAPGAPSGGRRAPGRQGGREPRDARTGGAGLTRSPVGGCQRSERPGVEGDPRVPGRRSAMRLRYYDLARTRLTGAAASSRHGAGAQGGGGALRRDATRRDATRVRRARRARSRRAVRRPAPSTRSCR